MSKKDAAKAREAIDALERNGGNLSKAARELGITRNSLKGRLSGADRVPATGEPSAPEEPPLPADKRRIVFLEDEVRRLRAELREAHRGGIDDEAILSILGVLSEAPCSPPQWVSRIPARSAKGTPEVPVTIWSDWHMGEVVSSAEVGGVNAYNLSIAEKRVQRLVDATINLCANHGPKNYPGIVVNLLGDFVSGGLHPELAKTDEEEVLPTVLRCRDLLVAALRRMADAFGSVYCPCTAGNHGRATPKPEYKRYSYKNFDWLVYQLLRREFADDPRIVIDVRASNEVHYKVYGTRILAMHGDMLGVKGGDGIIGAIGPIVRGEFKTRNQAASFGQDFDLLLVGHWHQSLWLPRAIVANTLKGFDEYAKNALRAPPSPPSQPLFFLHPTRGITSRWEIQVEDKAAPESEWLSFLREPA